MSERRTGDTNGHRIRRVLIRTHSAVEVTDAALPAVISILESAGAQIVVPPSEVAKHPRLSAYPTSEGLNLTADDGDVILVLGGDGSMLRALARDSGNGAPVIGVNFGRVGFLASIEPSELETGLTRMMGGDYRVLDLPSLSAEWSEGDVSAVNDLAILRGGESRLADLSFSIDGERVAQIRCDGLICSTPVGSTAYNLAAGGPTVSWKVRCFVVSFMAAHHLDTRPIVIAPEETLTVTNAAVVGDCDLLADGQLIGKLGPGRSISIGLGGASVHLGVFPEHSFFRRYREKFGRA